MKRALFVTLLVWFSLIAFFFATSGYSGSLERLEEHLDQYPTIHDFLSDEQGVLTYRELMKQYLNDDQSFDEVFKEFIRQIEYFAENSSEFAVRAWRKDSGWQTRVIEIQTVSNPKGLRAKREALEKQLKIWKSDLREITSEKNSEDRATLLAAKLIKEYGILPSEEVERMSRPQRNLYHARLRGNGERVEIRLHAAAKELSDYLIHLVLENSEVVRDQLYSMEPEIIASCLMRLTKPSEYVDLLSNLAPGVPSYLLSYLRFNSPVIESIMTEYNAGLRSMQTFESIGLPQLDLEVAQRMRQLQQQYPDNKNIVEIMNANDQAEIDSWEDKRSEVKRARMSIAKTFFDKAKFFDYEMIEENNSVALNSQPKSKKNHVRFYPSPRPFHSFFGGRKSNECIGGACPVELKPKRWARYVLNGSRAYFVEANSSMTGMIGIMLMERESPEGIQTKYEILDIMSKIVGIKAIVATPSGSTKNVILFDALIDHLPLADDSQGFVISDGNNVSQNIGGNDFIPYTRSYSAGASIGRPEEFEIADTFSKTILVADQNLVNSNSRLYNDAHIVHDGMRGDGKNVVLLVPTNRRKPPTQEQLEEIIYKDLFKDGSVNPQNQSWILAREFGITLNEVSFYRNNLTQTDYFWGLAHSRLTGPVSEYEQSDPNLKEIERLSKCISLVMKRDLLNPKLIEFIDRLTKSLTDPDGLPDDATKIARELMTSNVRLLRDYIDRLQTELVGYLENHPQLNLLHLIEEQGYSSFFRLLVRASTSNSHLLKQLVHMNILKTLEQNKAFAELSAEPIQRVENGRISLQDFIHKVLILNQEEKFLSHDNLHDLATLQSNVTARQAATIEDYIYENYAEVGTGILNSILFSEFMGPRNSASRSTLEMVLEGGFSEWTPYRAGTSKDSVTLASDLLRFLMAVCSGFPEMESKILREIELVLSEIIDDNDIGQDVELWILQRMRSSGLHILETVFFDLNEDHLSEISVRALDTIVKEPGKGGVESQLRPLALRAFKSLREDEFEADTFRNRIALSLVNFAVMHNQLDLKEIDHVSLSRTFNALMNEYIRGGEPKDFHLTLALTIIELRAVSDADRSAVSDLLMSEKAIPLYLASEDVDLVKVLILLMPDEVLKTRNVEQYLEKYNLVEYAFSSIFHPASRRQLVNLVQLGAPEFVFDEMNNRAKISRDHLVIEDQRLARRNVNASDCAEKFLALTYLKYGRSE